MRIEIKDAPGGPYDPPIRDYPAEKRYQNRVRAFMTWLVLATVMVLAAKGCVELNQFSCRKFWEQSGMQSQWTLFAGCQVEVQGRWVPEKTVRQLL